MSAQDKAVNWRVRWNTPDGMLTFTDICWESQCQMTRAEAESFGHRQVKAHPDKYASLATVYPIDSEVMQEGSSA